MSETNFIVAISIFEGEQGKHYILDGVKYSVYFPVAWALEHLVVLDGEIWRETGPNKCTSCFTSGFIRNVFVGYCSTCNYCYYTSQQPRGQPHEHWRHLPINSLKDRIMWIRCPYMHGVPKSFIGDQKNVDFSSEIPIDFENNYLD